MFDNEFRSKDSTVKVCVYMHVTTTAFQVSSGNPPWQQNIPAAVDAKLLAGKAIAYL